jgi:hypothetical protein
LLDHDVIAVNYLEVEELLREDLYQQKYVFWGWCIHSDIKNMKLWHNYKFYK